MQITHRSLGKLHDPERAKRRRLPEAPDAYASSLRISEQGDSLGFGDLPTDLQWNIVSRIESAKLSGALQANRLMNGLAAERIDRLTIRDASHLHAALRKFPNIVRLNIRACHGLQDAHLAYVAKLPRLLRLDLGDNRGLTAAGLERLADVKQLRALTVRGCVGIEDFTFLKQLVELRQLNVADQTRFQDYEILRGLTQLRGLDARSRFYPRNESALGALVRLERLEVNHISDYSVFDDVKQLATLHIAESYTTNAQSAFVARLSALRRLYLPKNAITNFDRLATRPELEVLDLSYGRAVEYFTPLLHMRNLRKINVSHTTASAADLEELSRLPALEYLDIRGCESIEPEDLRVFDTCANLRTLLYDGADPGESVDANF